MESSASTYRITNPNAWAHQAIPFISPYVLAASKMPLTLHTAGEGYFVFNTGGERFTDFDITVTRGSKKANVAYGDLGAAPVSLVLATTSINLPPTAEQRKHKLVPFYEAPYRGGTLAVAVGYEALRKYAAFSPKPPKGWSRTEAAQRTSLYDLIKDRI